MLRNYDQFALIININYIKMDHTIIMTINILKRTQNGSLPLSNFTIQIHKASKHRCLYLSVYMYMYVHVGLQTGRISTSPLVHKVII